MAAQDSPILELLDVRKSFGAVAAVAGVTETFRAGEYVCILGPSGCGKTTLLRLIAGFEDPDAGDVRLEGRSLPGVPPDRRDVNVVFQSYALFPHLNVRDNVAFGLRMRRRPAAEIADRTTEALRLVRLDALADRRPRQLSGGQQQRVALARALVNQPRVLLLDEPLSALDRSLRVAMQDELRALQRRTGVTFVHITHDQAEALTLSDRVVVMRAGRFEQVGTPDEVYHRPRTRFVAEFVGSSNLLEGTLSAGGIVRTAGGLTLACDAAALPPGPVVASLRPEALRLDLAPGDGAEDAALLGTPASPGAPARLPGRLARIASVGPVLECRVEAGGHLLTVHLAGRAGTGGLVEGAPVVVEVPVEAVVLLPAEGG